LPLCLRQRIEHGGFVSRIATHTPQQIQGLRCGNQRVMVLAQLELEVSQIAQHRGFSGCDFLGARKVQRAFQDLAAFLKITQFVKR
jgi:hypothetical protein